MLNYSKCVLRKEAAHGKKPYDRGEALAKEIDDLQTIIGIERSNAAKQQASLQQTIDEKNKQLADVEKEYKKLQNSVFKWQTAAQRNTNTKRLLTKRTDKLKSALRKNQKLTRNGILGSVGAFLVGSGATAAAASLNDPSMSPEQMRDLLARQKSRRLGYTIGGAGLGGVAGAGLGYILSDDVSDRKRIALLSGLAGAALGGLYGYNVLGK